MQRTIGAIFDALGVALTQMAFKTNIIFGIIPRSRGIKDVAAGFDTLLTANTQIRVDDPGIRSGFFIDMQGPRIRRTCFQARRFAALRADFLLIGTG